MQLSGDGVNIPADLARSNHFLGMSRFAAVSVHRSRADARADHGRAFEYSGK
jgi:hypothetical protein